MKVTLCGSVVFIDQMLAIKAQLEKVKHEVRMPPLEIKDEYGQLRPIYDPYWTSMDNPAMSSWLWARKEEAMHDNLDKVVWSDAILVLNYDKNSINNYIGPNAFLEMGLAFHLRKKIFLLNPIPEIGYKEEMIGMRPMIISGNLTLIG